MKQSVQPSTPSLVAQVATLSTTQSPTPRQTGRRLLVNTSALAGSSVWRIVTSFILQLVIARQLGVVGLGQYTIALAYLNVCQILSELGLPALLVRDLAQMPWLRRHYFRLALSVQLVAAVVVWGLLVLVTTLLPFSLEAERMLWIVGASLPFYAVTSVTQTLFQASERMETVMGIELAINTLILVGSVGVIVLGGTTQQLAVVLVVTQMISAALGLWLLRRSAIFAEPQEPVHWQWSWLWRRAGPFYSLSLADVLLQRTDIMLLSIVAGETVTGIYGAAYNLVRVGLKLVQNFWAALYPTLSRLHRQAPQHYTRLCNFSLRYGLLALLAAAAIGAGLTPDLLHLIYGAGYHEAIFVLEILLWSAPLYLIENYTQTLLMVERRPLQSLLVTGLHLLVLIALIPLLTPLLGAPGAAWAVLAASGAGALMSFQLLRRGSLPHTIAHPYTMIALAGGSFLLSLYLPLAWPWRLLIGGSLYGAVVWWAQLVDPQDWQLVRRILRKGESEATALDNGAGNLVK
jgi:O-antigen/teichoic acid export membrane protein